MSADAWFLSQFAIPLVILRIGTPPSFKVWIDHSVRILSLIHIYIRAKRSLRLQTRAISTATAKFPTS